MHRRAFLTSVAAGWIAEAVLESVPPVAGRVVGASREIGHLLRDGGAPRPSGPPERADVVVVGGGVSGLSAAWRLRDAGLDVLVLELEPFLGGTSAWGEDGVVPHPWGAHYLAAPNPGARAALRLLREMGAVTGSDAAGRPVFDPLLLCHAPQERVFHAGEWHPGLVPMDALGPAERDELARFSELEATMTAWTGADGRAAFQIPVEQSSRDPEVLALDRMSMAEWLAREGYRTPFLRWYVRYATLDDFGGLPEDVSAWAGLHYFGARKLRSPELEGSRFLVWPEGNGRLVKGLSAGSPARRRTGALVTRVAPVPGRPAVELDVFDTVARTAGRVEARAAIVAAPGFVVRRLVAGARERGVPDRAASPWLVANLHVRRPIDPDAAWDSVLVAGEGLGYVDARHQLTSLSERTVLTYYRAFGDPDVAAARARLAAAPWASLADGVLRDLAPAHPELREQTARMDLMVWGHAMPRPRPGFLGERPFEVPCALDERIAWAHVDQSGLALFEEAQARGVRAAEVVARAIGKDLGETWL
jgi:phytoene dehydrogenase-like protein